MRRPDADASRVTPAPSAADLVRTSLGLGLRGLRRAPRREALWRLWMPLDIDRVLELPWCGRHVVAAGADRILDISSPKLLACWLAESTPAEVLATDVWREEIESWSHLLAQADPSGERFARLRLELADGTALPYDDDAFDAVVSVSVIEHLAGEGDSAMMREIERVLRPGGIAVLTFPFRAHYAEELVSHDLYGTRYEGTPLFFYRHYDDVAVEHRLLAPVELEVTDRIVWTKGNLRETAASAHRLVPARLGVGRALGPLMVPLARRAMRSGDERHLATDNVLGLALRHPNRQRPSDVVARPI